MALDWLKNILNVDDNFNSKMTTVQKPDGSDYTYNAGMANRKPVFDAVEAASVSDGGSKKAATPKQSGKDAALAAGANSGNSVLSGAATGASVGGPWGAVAGAALGAMQGAQAKEQQQRAEYNSNLDSIAAALSTWG